MSKITSRSVRNDKANQKMGGFPGEEQILLRRPCHDGPAYGRLLYHRSSHRGHVDPLLCFRVSFFEFERLGVSFFCCWDFSCPFLAVRVSPFIPAVSGLLFVFTLSALLRTSFSDPGVIPRASAEEAALYDKQIGV